MNNEIKEINIKTPGQILDYVDTKEHLLELYNYITNLQQENERLRRKLATKKLFKKYKVEKDENLELRKIFELQQRIEKAIEYLVMCGETHDAGNYAQFKDYKEYKHLLNILRGDE